MLFFITLSYAVIVLISCLIMKRIMYHNVPTPLFTIKFLLVFWAANHVLIEGILRDDWSAAIRHIAVAYVAFAYYLYIVDDLAVLPESAPREERFTHNDDGSRGRSKLVELPTMTRQLTDSPLGKDS